MLLLTRDECDHTGLTPAPICAGTGLTPPTSAPGLGSARPHLHRDVQPHGIDERLISARQGMGPAHASKAARQGIRLDDLFNDRRAARRRLERDMKT